MEIPENLKTVDGIIAAMREEAKRLLESTGSDEGFSYMADLMEEAVKQERIKRDKVSFRCGDCARFGNDCNAGDADGNEDCVACERFVRRERRKELRAALLRGVDMARKGCRRMGIEWVEREQLGNVAKLREVLEKSGKAAREIQEATEEADTAEVAASIAEMCERALLFPPRNCDRGREAAEDAFTAEFGRPWTEEEARVSAWPSGCCGRTAGAGRCSATCWPRTGRFRRRCTGFRRWCRRTGESCRS